MTRRALEKAVLELPVAERAALVRRVRESLDEEEDEIEIRDPRMQAIIAKGVEERREGKASPAGDLLAELLRKDKAKRGA